MLEARSFQCPNCGSSVMTDGSRKEVKCEYCGSAVIVPEELRTRPAPPPVAYMPSYQADAQVGKEIATVGKVAAGIAVSSIVAPLVITAVIFCVVGVFVAVLLWGVNRTIQTAEQIPNTVMAPLLALTAAPTEASPTDTPEPTSIPLPTPFPRVLLSDNFRNSKSGWDQVKDSDYTLQYVKNGYRIFINAQDGGQSTWLAKSYKDVNVRVHAELTDGPEDGLIGVTCRVKKGVGFYSFEYSQDGYVSIEKYESKSGTSTSSTLAEGNYPDAVSADKLNDIRGDCVGDTLTFVLNDQVVLQAHDSDYPSGGIGLIVRTGSSGDGGIDVLFSNFVVTGP